MADKLPDGIVNLIFAVIILMIYVAICCIVGAVKNKKDKDRVLAHLWGLKHGEGMTMEDAKALGVNDLLGVVGDLRYDGIPVKTKIGVDKHGRRVKMYYIPERFKG